MVDTIKFSQMTAGGDLAPDDKTPGLLGGANVLFNNPFPLLPPGTTAERPAPAPAMYYRLRFNTSLESYEYYSPTAMVWAQLEDSIDNYVGPFVTFTSAPDITGNFDLGTLASGILRQTSLAGVATPAIAVNGVDYWGPGFPGYFQQPIGTKDISGNIVTAWTTAGVSAVNYLEFVNSIAGNPVRINALGADTDVQMDFFSHGAGMFAFSTLAPTNVLSIYNGTLYQHQTIFAFPSTAATRTVTWQDATGTVAFLSDLDAYVLSVLGTANQVEVNNTDPQNPVLLLPSVLNVPGTFNIQSTTAVQAIINDSTMATATATNLSTSLALKTYIDNTAGGTVDTVVGTTNQIDVDSTDPENPIVKLSSTISTPGTFTVQGTIAVDAIINDDSMATATATNLATALSIKNYIDAQALLGWLATAGTSQAADWGQGYVAQNAAQTTFTLPATAPFGSVVAVQGEGVGGWIVQANAGQTIKGGSEVTTTGGTITSESGDDNVFLLCVVADTVWRVTSTYSQGLTYA